ncbi:hypothetical protein ACFLZ5_04925 [Thermodesulfobacteriota bacterium]
MKTKHTSIIRLFGFAAIMVLGVVSIIGSGGGGGGGGTTNPETVFPLHEINTDAPQGFEATFTGTGVVTVEGTKYDVTGSYNIQVLADVYLATYDVMATPYQSLLNITITSNNATISILTTTYMNVPTAQNTYDGPVIQIVDNTDILIPIQYNPLPDVGQLGDFGEVTSWLYDNGDTVSGTWLLKSSQPGFINLEINYRVEDSLGNLIMLETDTFKISEDGVIVSATVNAQSFVDDVLIDFLANRN